MDEEVGVGVGVDMVVLLFVSEIVRGGCVVHHSIKSS